MTLDSRITMITLGVADIGKANAFYEKLGWRKSSASNDDVTFFHMNGTKLGLFGRAALAADADVNAAGSGFSGVALAQNLESEAAVDEAFAFAVSSGATAAKKPEKVFWGGYSGYFADPDGHLWELAYNPFMQLDDQGHMTLPD